VPIAPALQGFLLTQKITAAASQLVFNLVVIEPWTFHPEDASASSVICSLIVYVGFRLLTQLISNLA